MAEVDNLLSARFLASSNSESREKLWSGLKMLGHRVSSVNVGLSNLKFLVLD